MEHIEEAASRIELEEAGTFASQETNCYTANLYVDGRKIGTVGNDGHGGCDYFHGDQAAYKAADAWCRETLPKWEGLRGDLLDTDLELHCGRLIDDWMAARELRSTLRSNVLFTSTSDGRLYQVDHRGQLDATVMAVARAHPGAAILNSKPFEEALALYHAGTTP